LIFLFVKPSFSGRRRKRGIKRRRGMRMRRRRGRSRRRRRYGINCIRNLSLRSQF